jgi:hypothetical protein
MMSYVPASAAPAQVKKPLQPPANTESDDRSQNRTYGLSLRRFTTPAGKRVAYNGQPDGPDPDSEFHLKQKEYNGWIPREC